ncbi:MAG: hypothetical protein KAV99_05565 [Candidatus Latescibacteria bacterium]|nr:hypothetical protein [Candidatus Latescibacterota bacterium]
MIKLRKDSKDKEKTGEKKEAVVKEQQEEAEEELSLLSQKGKGSVKKVITDIDATVKEAAKESLKQLKLLEEGRCPECGRKTKQFLFTSICPHCGWSSFISPQQKGRMIVHLRDGTTLECDNTFDTQEGNILCISDDVVRMKVSSANVSYIEFAWAEEEIAERRKQKEREEAAVCDWCGRTAQRAEMLETFAAFGTYQERFLFCSPKCELAFQNHYPMRIHRDCYQRPCEDCNECIKKYYDTSSKKILSTEEIAKET